MTQPAPTFASRRKVRFADVDAAGIAFYPRYFEMLNEAVEDWLDGLGWSFGRLHLEKRAGVPARRIEADFTAASRLDDVLDITLTVMKVGHTSVELLVGFTCESEPRWSARIVLVMIDLDTGKATPWPGELRGKLEASAD
jgi:4-hydroxybenzoyl-CoA thioesterase